LSLLLDTHVLLWWLTDDPSLGSAAKTRIGASTDVRVSIASFWEMSIKARLGRLVIDLPTVAAHLPVIAMRLLPVQIDHVLAEQALPDIHRDPFDRMIAAQCRAEALTLVTADRQLLRYPLPTIDAGR
jgi:PIN domain nuclease of toxin-antitoxin system